MGTLFFTFTLTDTYERANCLKQWFSNIVLLFTSSFLFIFFLVLGSHCHLPFSWQCFITLTKGMSMRVLDKYSVLYIFIFSICFFNVDTSWCRTPKNVRDFSFPLARQRILQNIIFKLPMKIECKFKSLNMTYLIVDSGLWSSCW